MKVSSDRVAQLLEAELGAGNVTAEPALLAAHNVDGRAPALLCFPSTVDQITAALRVCSEASATVTPWGAGTAMGIGNPPRQVDILIGLEQLNLLVEHDQANLTATIQSGYRLAALQEILARQNQFLPFDPFAKVRATVGGVVAANLNGPRRSHYGNVRDLVIGMKVVLASGEQVKAGGKVVKNVAGYDMCKLFVGSLGTLGIIAEVTVRMAPIPETAATLITTGNLSQVMQLTSELSDSKLLPSAVFLLSPDPSKADEMGQSQWRVAVWCEGFKESVARHLHDAEEMATRIELATETLQGAAHSRFWDGVSDFPIQAGRLVYRVTVPRASVAAVIQMVQDWTAAGFRAEMVSDVAMGVVWISTGASNEAIQCFARLCTDARAYGGYALILGAPPDLKRGIDVWGPAPSSFSLMRNIKQQFDPENLLNPGRFVGGL